METTKTLPLTKKTIPSKTYLCHTFTTTLADMMNNAGELVDALYETVFEHGLEKVGVVEFIYIDCNGQPNDPFTLKIAMPVKAGSKVGNTKFAIETRQEFKCVTYTHKGDVTELGSVYTTLYTTLRAEDYKLGNEVREVYEKFVSLHSPENSTEIQVGLL